MLRKDGGVHLGRKRDAQNVPGCVLGQQPRSGSGGDPGQPKGAAPTTLPPPPPLSWSPLSPHGASSWITCRRGRKQRRAGWFPTTKSSRQQRAPRAEGSGCDKSRPVVSGRSRNLPTNAREKSTLCSCATTRNHFNVAALRRARVCGIKEELQRLFNEPPDWLLSGSLT